MRRIIIVLALLLAGAALFAQTQANHTVTITIDAFACIARDVADVALAVQPPGTPGNPATGDTGDQRLWYTVLNAGATGYITAALTAGTLAQVPDGTSLWVLAESAEYGNALNAGAGPGGSYPLTVGGAAQTIVNSITSGATGTTGTDGADILFTLQVDTPASLDTSQDGTLTVTYTIAAS
jgi:hypothetical protein